MVKVNFRFDNKQPCAMYLDDLPKSQLTVTVSQVTDWLTHRLNDSWTSQLAKCLTKNLK